MYRILSDDSWMESVGIHRGVAIKILDIFEDMLDSKDVLIPDDDRTGDESEACLYGSTYADLEQEITELLKKYFVTDHKEV